MTWLKLHWQSVALAAGAIWLLLAALIARKVEKPTAPWWKAKLYFVFVDGPIWFAAHNGELTGVFVSIFGAKIGAPYLSWTKAVTDKAAEIEKTLPALQSPKIWPVLLFAGLGLGAFGCGEVGLQQGVANAATIVKASGTVLTEYDQQQDEQAVELAQTGNIDGSAKLRNEWRPKLKKARAVFRGANAGLLSIEIGLNAWRASKAKALDWAALGVEVAKIVADVVKVMQDLGVKLPAIPGLTIRGPAPPPSLLLAAVLR